MARLTVAACFGMLVGLGLGAACQIHAEGTEPDDETIAAAQEAGVDPVDLLGAANTTGLTPAEYLAESPSWTAVGELAVFPLPPAAPAVSSCGWPICGALGQRLYCIEGYESRHFGGAVNRSSGAAGWLQWLPSTARAWGVTVGNRWSEWNAASRIAALGDRFFWSQWRADYGYCQ